MTRELASDETRFFVTGDLEFTSSDDSLLFARNENGSMCISIDSPWHGSTDTGFGAQLSFELTRDEITRLVQWLGNTP